MTPPSDGCECPAGASQGRHYASASWGYFPYFLESLESSDVHVEELYVAYYPDGSKAGEFPSRLEALRFLEVRPLPRAGEPVMTDSQTIAMLTAAEQIADGLADLARAIYDRDERWRHALAAANAASTQMQEARREAERPPDEEYDGHV